MLKQNNYYVHIDGLRALAVLAVLLVHLDIHLFSGGYVGVDIFFVISGFLITNIIFREIELTGEFSLVNFYTRRIRRILPALVFTLTISFIFSVWLLNLAKFKVFGASLAAAAISFSNIFFYKTAGYFDVFSQSMPLLHTWSLGVEEQFYLFWPLGLLMVFKINKKLIIHFFVTVFIFSLVWSIYEQNKNFNGLYYLSQFRAFEFIIGASLVWLLKFKTNKNIINELLSLVGIILILYSIFIFDSNTLFPSYNALPPTIGAALLIYSGTAKYSGYILRNSIVRFIGLISYSLYLIHWPLIIFLKTYHENIGQNFSLSEIEKFLVFIVSITIGTLMYYFIEQPFRRNIPKEKAMQIKTITRWSIVTLLLILLGTSIYYSKGWLWRSMSPELNDKIQNLPEYHVDNWGGSGFHGGLIHSGDNVYPDIIMMGDSHAGMLFTGMVNEIAKPNNLTVFTVSGGGAGDYESSLLLPGITRINSNQKSFDESTEKAYKEVIEKLLQSKDAILIYSADYSSQLPVAGFLETHKNLNINPTKMILENDYKPLIAALDKLRFMMKGHKLILIGDVPRSSKYIPLKCIPQLKWFPNNCSQIEKEDINVGARNVNVILKDYALKHKNVYFINPYDIFCKNGYCLNVDEKAIPFYSDGSHLSKAGSTYLMKKIKNQIIDIYNQ